MQRISLVDSLRPPPLTKPPFLFKVIETPAYVSRCLAEWYSVDALVSLQGEDTQTCRLCCKGGEGEGHCCSRRSRGRSSARVTPCSSPSTTSLRIWGSRGDSGECKGFRLSIHFVHHLSLSHHSSSRLSRTTSPDKGALDIARTPESMAPERDWSWFAMAQLVFAIWNSVCVLF